MTSREWDAYKSLGITTRDSGSATCLGTNRYGKRCRWDIEHGSFQEICALLDRMERRPPSEALSSLDQLARLCLSCEFHSGQRWDVISVWKAAIAEAGREYEKGMALKMKIAELEAGSGSQQALQGLNEEIDRLRYQLAMEQTARSSTANELAQRITQSNNFQEILQEENCKVRNAVTERDGLLQQVAWLNSDLEQWKTKYYQKESALQVESNRSTNLERIIAEAEYHRDMSTVLSQKVADLEAMLEEEKQKSPHQSDQFAEAMAAQTELQRAHMVLQAELQKNSQEQDQLGNELALEKDECSNMRQALSQTRQELATTKSELEGAQASIEASEADNEQLRTSASEYEKQISSSVRELRRNLSETQERLTSAQHDISTKNTALNKITSTWETLRKDFEDYKAITTAEREADATSINQLRQDLASTEDKLSATSRTLEEAQREVSELRSSAEEMKQQDSAVIENLTSRIELYRSHPFRAFFMTMMETFSRRPMAFLEGLRAVRFSKVVHTAASGVEPLDQ